MRIACAAYGEVGKGNLIELLSNYSVDDLLVFTYDRESNDELLQFLRYMDIRHVCKNINTQYDLLKEFNPQYLVSMFYRHIIRPEILDLAEDTLNAHQSLLPLHRGRFSTFWTIFEEDDMAGITYHRMAKEVDAGEILHQALLPVLSPDETAYSLHRKNINLVIHSFAKAFRKMLEGAGFKQVGEGSSYVSNDLPFGGVISADESLEKIHRFARAMYFPPHKGAVVQGRNRAEVYGYPSIEACTDAINRARA
jgi:UDP-4-amino-4-deoxy-L-arabinose formyltransferase/UDP-glucuronic acid dehydrogenase (UDP-4-keto-hexauronic acid decarboxylating)